MNEKTMTDSIQQKKEEQYYVDVVSAMAERTIFRLWVVILVLLWLLFGTNAWWIWRESQFADEVTETVTTSTDGGGNAYGSIVSGNNSEVNYGESDSNQNDKASP